MTNTSLSSGFLKSSESFPDRPALEVGGNVWTYASLRDECAAIAATLQQQPKSESAMTAVLGYRSITAFSGILSALMSGDGYVPLHPGFPADRTAKMLSRSLARRLVVGPEGLDVLEEILPQIDVELTIVLPHSDNAEQLAQMFPQHRWLCRGELASGGDWQLPKVDESSAAYLLFTSGSTGEPKGVSVSHSSILRFIDVVTKRYSICEDDRFSQMFEPVFDLSLFDFFVAWANGASLCCPSRGDARLPARYINESKITIWFSVPSLGMAMKRMRMLRPGIFPTLRVSLFCGEAMLTELADAWDLAAPNSIVENLYGPTEATLACTWYRWQGESSNAESPQGVVPIGYAFPAMNLLIVDEQLNRVREGESGELLLGGPQLAIGYWQDETRTAATFLVPPGEKECFYRTGDLVRQERSDGPVLYIGRIDNQVKIRGNRVELGEIESALREVTGVENAIALGWPETTGGYEGVVAFIQADGVDDTVLAAGAQARLPAYMVPSAYHRVADMPLNQNGKIDRNALRAILVAQKKPKPRAS